MRRSCRLGGPNVLHVVFNTVLNLRSIMHALKLGIGATRWASSEIIARKHTYGLGMQWYTCLIIVRSSSMKSNDFGLPLVTVGVGPCKSLLNVCEPVGLDQKLTNKHYYSLPSTLWSIYWVWLVLTENYKLQPNQCCNSWLVLIMKQIYRFSGFFSSSCSIIWNHKLVT
jgi:hypothetical protein